MSNVKELDDEKLIENLTEKLKEGAKKKNLNEYDDSDILSEFENRIDNYSEFECTFIKDKFDWLTYEEAVEREDAEKFTTPIVLDSLTAVMKYDYIASIFAKYSLEEIETLLPLR